MKRQSQFIPILWIALAFFCWTVQAAPQPRIINGRPASTAAYPWMVGISIVSASNPLLVADCGGSLIAPEWVLSAAHCFTDEAGTALDSGAVERTTVLLDSDNIIVWPPGAIVRQARQVVVHPSYNPNPATSANVNDFDIALVELDAPVDGLTPVKLLAAGSELAAGTLALTMGWGMTESGESSDTLLQTEQSIVSDTECLDLYGYGITGNMLCAGGVTATDLDDSCQGDSGGPLVIDDNGGHIQVGITSFGGLTKPCGEAGIPGVYARVDALGDFIREYVDAAVFIPLGTASAIARLDNISVRCNVQSGQGMAIAGFVIDGTGSKQVLLRALRVPEVSPDFDPQLVLMRLVGGQWVSLAENDDWHTGADAGAIQNLPSHLVPAALFDSALLATLEAGVYSALVQPRSAPGIGVVGVDDLDNPATMTSYLINLSARCDVASGDANAVAGFIIAGEGDLPALLRGLRVAGLGSNPLDPALELVRLYPGTVSATVLEINGDATAHARWSEIAQLPFHLLPPDSSDAAILRDLPAGVYGMLLKPADNQSGLGVVGVDALP